MGSSGNWVPLIYTVMIIAGLGIVIPMAVSSVTDVNNVQLSPTAGAIDNFLLNGINVTLPGSSLIQFFGGSGQFQLNIFGWIPDWITTYFVTTINSLSLIPLFIIIPLGLLALISIVWSVIALIKPGSS